MQTCMSKNVVNCNSVTVYCPIASSVIAVKIGMSLVVKMRHLISKKLIRDLRRRSSILRPSPQNYIDNLCVITLPK